ncbi:MAG: TrkH family potassium uptake protein [Candidatus Poribacteria bacterium]|nr:TrkH family potassium uptake protein [Candidatus Poribacteria bacterium]
MNVRLLFYTLGNLWSFLSVAMLAPLGVSLYFTYATGDTDLAAFVIAFPVTLGVGLTLRFALMRARGELRNREGFAVVALGWATIALFGALPYYFHGVFEAPDRSELHEFIFCYFESISGFTTTGATVLTEIESLPHGILFWRSFTHWLGGMGIVVLAVAILPLLGVGGMQLYRAEAPGPQTDRLTPRIAVTAKLMWGVYILVSLVEFVLLLFGGMDLFDSACHTFGTMATGGFATKNASIGHYDSVYIDTVITVFMFLSGANFALHYKALRGDIKAYWRNAEFRFYCVVFLVSVSLIMWNTMVRVDGAPAVYDSFGDSLRFASFQVASIITTTGYATADFEVWPPLSQFLLVTLMFFGGCAGSTGGGIKHIRFLVLIKQGYMEVKRLILPRAIQTMRIDDAVVPPEIVRNILGFFFMFIAIMGVATCAMTALGMDIVSATTAVISAMGNIGPGLGTVGPTNNYAHVPALGKVILSLCMMLGRLELYTVLILFAPQTWKK